MTEEPDYTKQYGRYPLTEYLPQDRAKLIELGFNLDEFDAILRRYEEKMLALRNINNESDWYAGKWKEVRKIEHKTVEDIWVVLTKELRKVRKYAATQAFQKYVRYLAAVHMACLNRVWKFMRTPEPEVIRCIAKYHPKHKEAILFFPDSNAEYRKNWEDRIDHYVFMGQHGTSSMDYYRECKSLREGKPYTQEIKDLIKHYEKHFDCTLKLVRSVRYTPCGRTRTLTHDELASQLYGVDNNQ